MEEAAFSTRPPPPPAAESPLSVLSTAPTRPGQASTSEQPQPLLRQRPSRRQTFGAMAAVASPSGVDEGTLAPISNVRLARMRMDDNIRMARRRQQQYSREHVIQSSHQSADEGSASSFRQLMATPPPTAAAAKRPSFEDGDLQQVMWTFSNTDDAGSSSSAVKLSRLNPMLYQSAPSIPRPSRPPPSNSTPVTDLDRLAYSMQLITRGRPLSEVMMDIRSARRRWNFS